MFEIIKNNIRVVMPELKADQITIDKQLKDLGANSIDRMEIIFGAMEEAGIKMPLSDLAQAGNIEGLVDILVAKWI